VGHIGATGERWTADNHGQPGSTVPPGEQPRQSSQQVIERHDSLSHGRSHRFEPCHAHQHKLPPRTLLRLRLPADCQQTTDSGPSALQALTVPRGLSVHAYRR
jgi:hypothetical protein